MIGSYHDKYNALKKTVSNLNDDDLPLRSHISNFVNDLTVAQFSSLLHNMKYDENDEGIDVEMAAELESAFEEAADGAEELIYELLRKQDEN